MENKLETISSAFTVGFMVGAVMFIMLNDNTTMKSPKPITPELQITGNGVDMDTVYIYRLEE